MLDKTKLGHRFKDMTGQRSGLLEYIEPVRRHEGNKSIVWKMLCHGCMKHYELIGSTIRVRKATSCMACNSKGDMDYKTKVEIYDKYASGKFSVSALARDYEIGRRSIDSIIEFVRNDVIERIHGIVTLEELPVDEWFDVHTERSLRLYRKEFGNVKFSIDALKELAETVGPDGVVIYDKHSILHAWLIKLGMHMYVRDYEDPNLKSMLLSIKCDTVAFLNSDANVKSTNGLSDYISSNCNIVRIIMYNGLRVS